GVPVLHPAHGGDLHPGPLGDVLRVIADAGHRQEVHVLGAADHGEPAGGEVVPVPGGLAHHGTEPHPLPLVHLGIVHDLHEPEAVVLVGDHDGVGGQVEGGDGAVHVVLAGAVGIFQIDVRPAV